MDASPRLRIQFVPKTNLYSKILLSPLSRSTPPQSLNEQSGGRGDLLYLKPARSALFSLLVVTIGTASLLEGNPAVATPVKNAQAVTVLPTLLSQADTGVLKINDSGDAVSQLQSQLSTLGFYTGQITGYFGPQTQDAVIRFQQANGLDADGVVGPTTLATIQQQISQGQPSPSPSPSPSSDLLQLNSTGDRVSQLQTQLQTLGYYNGAINGVFDSPTQSAVISFQQANGLGSDGIVGPATSAAIQQQINNRGSSAPPSATGPLQLNSTGDRVSQLQRQLQTLRYYNGSISGFFDDQTQAAVIRFQQDSNLTADGIVGPATDAALTAAINASVSPTPTPTPTPTPPSIPTPTPTPTGILQQGSSGTDVTNLQLRLQSLGFYNGPITGFYDLNTENAVRAFQQANNLTVDGIAGPATLNAVNLQTASGPTPTPTALPADRGRFSVYELQRRLQDRGFYTGPLDGVLGQGTRDAVQRAQRQYNLSQQDILRGNF
jgi:peptidoglycan hydrolase-like protein with peptidoglycan-binding domain